MTRVAGWVRRAATDGGRVSAARGLLVGATAVAFTLAGFVCAVWASTGNIERTRQLAAIIVFFRSFIAAPHSALRRDNVQPADLLGSAENNGFSRVSRDSSRVPSDTPCHV
jgi:hypothetical protein